MNSIFIPAELSLLAALALSIAMSERLRTMDKRLRLVAVSVALAAITASIVLRFPTGLASNALVVIAAGSAGAFLGPNLNRRGALAAFVTTLAVVDFLSFSGGLTNRIIESYQSGESRLLEYLTIVAPLEGVWRPVVGVSDLFAGACVFSGMRAMRYSVFWASATPVTGLTVALVIGVFVGGVYALPFLAAVVMLALLHSPNAGGGHADSAAAPCK